MEQLIKDQCERNRDKWDKYQQYETEGYTIDGQTEMAEIRKTSDQITQQTAEAVMSAVREMMEQEFYSYGVFNDLDPKSKVENLLTQLQAKDLI